MNKDPKIPRPKTTAPETSVESKTVAPSSLKPVQHKGLNISESEETLVRERALATSGKTAETPTVEGRGPGQKDEALVSKESTSMAANPAFEAAAMQWEDKFGGVAYNDPRATAVVDEAAAKAVAYLKVKAGEWEAGNEKLQKDLELIGIGSPGWSGGVGKEASAVMDALTTGSFGVKIAHVENFLSNVWANDLLETDEVSFKERNSGAGFESNEHLDSLHKGKKEGKIKSKWDTNMPVGTATDQWHMRATRFPGEKTKEASERTSEDLQGLGVEVSEPEKKFMGLKGKKDKLAWEEGARVWALNEKDKWVFAQRQMSLPMAAGVSGTTARLMRSFRNVGVGNPADNRLACIAYLLPTHHHSLVEVMEGASGNGGPAFSSSQRMYREIQPFTEPELRSKVGPFPDEVSGKSK
jgi:hypothetical protein